ncbi:MAG TPA: hypothetical protein VI454_19115 [Verrucomicrobiae bacterium]
MDSNTVKIIQESLRDTQAFPWWIYLLLLAVPGAGAFLGTYLRKKGENLATKEDLSELTELVERVRTQHAERLENLAHENRKALEQTSREHQFRMAALDRRLEAHQQAYTLWRKLFFSVHQKEVGEVVMECQNWWNKNCLYLDPESREAFLKAFHAAHLHADLLHGSVPTNEIRENFAILQAAGDAIVRGAALPPIKDMETGRILNESESGA